MHPGARRGRRSRPSRRRGARLLSAGAEPHPAQPPRPGLPVPTGAGHLSHPGRPERGGQGAQQPRQRRLLPGRLDRGRRLLGAERRRRRRSRRCGDVGDDPQQPGRGRHRPWPARPGRGAVAPGARRFPRRRLPARHSLRPHQSGPGRTPARPPRRGSPPSRRGGASLRGGRLPCRGPRGGVGDEPRACSPPARGNPRWRCSTTPCDERTRWRATPSSTPLSSGSAASHCPRRATTRSHGPPGSSHST